MKKKKWFVIFVAVIAVLSVTVLWKRLNPDEFTVGEDEIALYIRLDLEEDIGLLVYDYTANGHEASGGVSNADKSLLNRDEVLLNIWNREELDCYRDKVDMWMQFRIITEYDDPNFPNIYPEEITVKCDPITWEACFGKTYNVLISGSKGTGYTITLEE